MFESPPPDTPTDQERIAMLERNLRKGWKHVAD
mgnify:CR=1 FL=1